MADRFCFVVGRAWAAGGGSGPLTGWHAQSTAVTSVGEARAPGSAMVAAVEVA